MARDAGKKLQKPKVYQYDGKTPIRFWDFSRVRVEFAAFLKEFSDVSHMPGQQKAILRTFDRIAGNVGTDFENLMKGLDSLTQLFNEV